MSNYAQDAIDLVKKHYDGSLSDEFAEVYALLLMVNGPFVTLEDVHDAWSIVRNRTRPDHPSIVPFDDLSPEVQGLDQPFVDTIVKSSREILGITA